MAAVAAILDVAAGPFSIGMYFQTYPTNSPSLKRIEAEMQSLEGTLNTEPLSQDSDSDRSRAPSLNGIIRTTFKMAAPWLHTAHKMKFSFFSSLYSPLLLVSDWLPNSEWSNYSWGSITRCIQPKNAHISGISWYYFTNNNNGDFVVV